MGGFCWKYGREGDVTWDYGCGKGCGIEGVSGNWEGEKGGGREAHYGGWEVFEVNYKVEDGPFKYRGAFIVLPMNTTRR